MTLLLKQLFNLLKMLNSDSGTNPLAAGVTAGFILGMTPSFSLQSALIFILLFVFRIQFGMALLSMFCFSFVAYILDPIFHLAGSLILQADLLKELFTQLYNLPIIPFTRFYNTIVMGSVVISIILSPIIFVISKILIKKYRTLVVEKIKNTKAWKFIKATTLYKWYYKFDKIYG